MVAKRFSPIKFVLQRRIHMAQESHPISHEAAPRPFSQVIRELPGQYLTVLTRPTKETFVREMDKASWSGVWIQLLIIVLITSLIGWLRSLILPPFNTHTFFGRLSMLIIQPNEGISAGNLITRLIGLPLGVFLGVGIFHLLAKAFGGHGTYLAQAYTALLFSVPLSCITGLLALIPSLGWLLGLAGYIFDRILYVVVVMAVYRLGGGRATAVVLIPTVLVVLLVAWLSFMH
jgi:hypothetical protein